MSSSDHSAFSDRKISLEEEEKPPRYIDDRKGVLQEKEKSLPAIPPREKHSRLDEYDPYAVENTDPRHYPSSSSTHTNIHPLTTASQLAAALGPENAPYSTEIDTIPCAGVRVPHGPLTGLLAWRLVVRTLPPTKGKRGWWSDKSNSAAKTTRRNSYTPHPPPPPVHAFSYSESDTQMVQRPLTSISTISLPLSHARTLSSTPERVNHNAALVFDSSRPQSAMLTRQPHIHPNPAPFTTAVAANFILDTSLPYSIISRDTLMALGYPSHRFPPPATSNPHSLYWEEEEDSNAVVTLSIQNIPTRLRIARPGEASRLGVQFLHDAGVSVFFPRDGEAVGPVLYLESARLLKDVPRTVTTLPGLRERSKMTLPQRVRALFGLA
jgi:hypothetical protein